jgi:hypothetical protein
MSAWSKEPPTHKEWLEARNHGRWWVKFLLCPEETEIDEDGETITWPEAWYTEIVQITSSYEDFGDLLDSKNARLHARGGSHTDRFDLDDKEKTKDMYWQPVAPPLDDIKDQRPEVD